MSINAADNEHDKELNIEEYEENDMENDDEIIDSVPSCPYCKMDSANCKHVILVYDASFQEFLSGYILDNYDEFFEPIYEILDKYIKNGIQKIHRDKNLHDFISYAFETYDKTRDYYCFHMQLFINTLGVYIFKNGGKHEQYSDSGSAASFSSSYEIYFAKNPENTLKNFTKFIADEFNI